MLQNIRTSSFTFIKLMNIAIKLISKLISESSLFYEEKLYELTELAFYINNIFFVYDSFEKQYSFLKDHFLLKILWIKLRLFFLKLSLFVIKIRVLRQDYEIERRIFIKN